MKQASMGTQLPVVGHVQVVEGNHRPDTVLVLALALALAALPTVPVGVGVTHGTDDSPAGLEESTQRTDSETFLARETEAHVDRSFY
jgi:hypothetical protein